jgi:hypothetical protein
VSASLKAAVRRLDAQLTHMCGKESNQPANRESALSDVHTQSHEAAPHAHEATPGSSLSSPWNPPQGGDNEEPARWHHDSDISSEHGPGHTRAKNEIVVRRANSSRENWADASCQIGWSENVADKSCQAHDIDSALTRLRWAVRNAAQRKSEKITRRQAMLDNHQDREIAESILYAISKCRSDADAQVSAAKNAKEEYLEKNMQSMRRDQQLVVPPILPLVVEGERDDDLPRGGGGCFGGSAKGAGALVEARAAHRQKRKEHDVLVYLIVLFCSCCRKIATL